MSTSRRGNHEGSRPVLRQDGRWQVALRYIDADGTAKRTTVTGKTQKDVRDRAKEVRQRLDKRQPPRDVRKTVGVFATEWLGSTLAVSDRKESTKSLYANLAKRHIVSDRLGSVALDQLTPRRIEAWVSELMWVPGINRNSTYGCKVHTGRHPQAACRCGIRVVQSLTVLKAFATNQEPRIGPLAAYAEVDVWGRVAPFAPDDDWRFTLRAELAEITGPLHLAPSHAMYADALAEHYGVEVQL